MDVHSVQKWDVFIKPFTSKLRWLWEKVRWKDKKIQVHKNPLRQFFCFDQLLVGKGPTLKYGWNNQ